MLLVTDPMQRRTVIVVVVVAEAVFVVVVELPEVVVVVVEPQVGGERAMEEGIEEGEVGGKWVVEVDETNRNWWS